TRAARADGDARADLTACGQGAAKAAHTGERHIGPVAIAVCVRTASGGGGAVAQDSRAASRRSDARRRAQLPAAAVAAARARSGLPSARRIGAQPREGPVRLLRVRAVRAT